MDGPATNGADAAAAVVFGSRRWRFETDNAFRRALTATSVALRSACGALADARCVVTHDEGGRARTRNAHPIHLISQSKR